MKKSLATALVVATLALTSACGGGGGDRPGKSEVAKAITSNDSVFGSTIPKPAADCVAEVLVDSKLSDKTLQAIVDGDKDYKGSKSDEKALSSLTSELGTCVTK